MKNQKTYSHMTTLRGSSIEPVLRTVLDGEATLDTLARLGCDTTRSVYPVDLAVSPVLVSTNSRIELQPRDAAETVGTQAGGSRRRALCIEGALNAAVVSILGLEHEQWDAGGSELMVARQPFLGFWGGGNGVVEGQVGDFGERLCVKARGVAGYVEEGGDGADSFGDVGCGGRGAGVVLGAAADGDVAGGGALGWGGEGCGGIGKLDVRQVTEGVSLLQLLVDTDGQVLSRDECCDRIGILCWSGEECGRCKSQDEAEGG